MNGAATHTAKSFYIQQCYNNTAACTASFASFPSSYVSKWNFRFPLLALFVVVFLLVERGERAVDGLDDHAAVRV